MTCLPPEYQHVAEKLQNPIVHFLVFQSYSAGFELKRLKETSYCQFQSQFDNLITSKLQDSSWKIPYLGFTGSKPWIIDSLRWVVGIGNLENQIEYGQHEKHIDFYDSSKKNRVKWPYQLRSLFEQFIKLWSCRGNKSFWFIYCTVNIYVSNSSWRQ